MPDAAGHWKAAFVHGQGFDLKGAFCGDKIEIVAECTKSHDDEKCEDKREVPLPCQPGGGGGCPSVAVTVTPGNCNAAGTSRAITFAVTVGGGAQIQYMWNFGDGTPLTALAPGSGSFSQTHSYPVGATAATYNANLIVVVPPGCTASPDPITVTVQPCGATSACPDNPRFVAELHLPGNQRDRVDLEAPCVPAGDYTVSLSNSYPAGTSLFWTVDEAPGRAGRLDRGDDRGRRERRDRGHRHEGRLPAAVRDRHPVGVPRVPETEGSSSCSSGGSRAPGASTCPSRRATCPPGTMWCG